MGARALSYRADIDGLRAFAVMAVVLFHLGFGPVPGGFVGVDVFFVISGFLITGLILNKLKQGQFSFWEFYARRTRRIYPALFVMILVVLLAGYFVLTPAEYSALGESAAYSSAFLANVYFWLNTGYFDRSADTMPLLHIWSIGVEEQFYLIWPILLVVVWRYVRVGRKVAFVALSGATTLLAALCIVWTALDANSAFYLPFTRLWEFTLGALVLALPEIRKSALAGAISALGMGAILYASLIFTTDLAYPGLYAILPCLGTAAVLSADGRGPVGRFLSLGPNILLGKMSYSLYLWHWPMIVFYDTYAGEHDQKVWLIVTALAVAIFSWRFVELPIRRRRDHPRRSVAYGATVAAFTGALSLLVALMAGFPGRLPEEFRGLSSDEDMNRLHCTERVVLQGLGKKANCIVGVPWANATRRALLWGDSHARHLAPLLDISARGQGISLVYWPGCPPFIDKDKVGRNKPKSAELSDRCTHSRRQVLDWIAKTPSIDLVIIANRWSIYPDTLYNEGLFGKSDEQRVLTRIKQGLDKTLSEIDPQQHSILLIRDVPSPGFDVPNCALETSGVFWRRQVCKHDLNFFQEVERPLQRILDQAASGTDRIDYVDPVKAMCGPKGCPIRVNAEIIFSDSHHMRHNLEPMTFQQLSLMLGFVEALRAGTSKPPASEPVEIPSPQKAGLLNASPNQ
jgi:peptidoglycan/LPS O-acetylase OafA/YrhL